MKIQLIHGTWGAKWAEPDALFPQMLARHDMQVCQPAFEWSGDVSGIPSFTGSQKHSDWRAGGFALALYLARMPLEERNVIAHSHGGQCCAYAAARYNVAIRRLVTVSTPVRSDMEPVWMAAKPRIGYWLHVAAKSGDWMARMGQMFDGHVGWQSRQKQADVNAILPGIGHTGILSDPTHIQLWKSQELLRYINLPDSMMAVRDVAGV